MKKETQKFAPEDTKESIFRDVTKTTSYGRERVRVRSYNFDDSRTQAQFQDQCDINQIMKKYLKGNPITHLNRSQGVYADLTKIKDYQSSLNQVMQADATFMTLPSSVRSHFNNNPQELLTFLQNPNNRDKAIELGLIDKPQQAAPAATPEPSKTVPPVS